MRSGHLGSSLLISCVLAGGCSVGESSGSSFSSLTFGVGGPGGGVDTGDEEPTGGTMGESGGGSGQGSGGLDGGSGDSADGATDGACTPSEELCNGLDDDCNGMIDDADPEGGSPCETGMPGTCASGLTACEAGVLACVPQAAPMAELCNGLDDDCNGMIDDANPEGGAACDTGMPGACLDGLTECTVGGLTCVPQVAPAAEQCNNIDDDCNGAIDDGNPGGGGACNTGQPGICSAGTMQCSAGALSCSQNQMPAASDTCGNGLDDNCNGSTDEGCCAHDVCIQGGPLTVGCSVCVSQICAFDSFCCTTSWDVFCVNAVPGTCGIAC